MRTLFAGLRLALRAIARAKLRSSLTVLGILIGVAAVVIVVALGQGMRDQVATQVSSMGANVIYVFQQATQSSGVRQKTTYRLSEEDGDAILKEATSVSDVTSFSSTSAQVVAGDKNVNTQVMGVSSSYFRVRGFTLARGQSFTDQDISIKARVVVIGDTVRENLFGNTDALGQYIRIGRHAYRIIGLLDRKGQSPFGEDQDDRVIMSAGSFRSRVLPAPPGRVHMLLASATNELTVDRAVSQIDQILRQRHHIDPDDEPDFGTSTQAEMRRSQEAIFDTLSLLLLAIAAVSLLVGGIGVMNIMLVSVTERTHEIGIRMAIGAGQADILIQFLIEAVTLSILGGMVGLAVGAVVIRFVGEALGWAMGMPLRAVAVAVGTSGAIGIIFGFFPARRAARMDPITALRHE